MAPNKLAERFHETWDRCSDGVSDPSPVWRVLQYRYAEPHRYYHTLGHIAQCLIVASEEAEGEMRYEYKRRTEAVDRPPLDFERDDDAPVALLPR